MVGPRDARVKPGPSPRPQLAPAGGGEIGLPTLSDRTAFATAMELQRQGFWSIAICPAGVELGNKVMKGKEPLGGKGWGLDRWDEDKLRREFDRYPRAGVGVCLGPGRAPGGGWLVDLEGDGTQAEASLRALIGRECSGTMGWESRRGRHLLFEVDGERLFKPLVRAGAEEGKGQEAGTWKLDALPGLEFRIGGYHPNGVVKQIQSVTPPTAGEDGNPRRWNGHGSIARLPEAAYAVLGALPPKMLPNTVRCAEPSGKARMTPQEARGAPATGRGGISPAYGETALRDECERVAGAPDGERHNTLRSSAMRIAGLAKGGILDWPMSRARLAEAAGRCGLPPEEGRQLLDDTFAYATPRAPRSRADADGDGEAATPSRSKTPIRMHSPQTENDIHARPPKETMYVIPAGSTMYVTGPEPQPCMSLSPEPQPCMSLSLDLQQLIFEHACSADAVRWSEALWDL